MDSNQKFSEQDFINNFFKYKERKGNSWLSVYESFEQVQTPNGIPDVVLFKKEYSEELGKISKVIADRKNQKLILTLSYKFQKSEKIFNQLDVSLKEFKKTVDDLTENKILERKFDLLRISQRYRFLNNPDVHILEFKLTDWKGALGQAVRYSNLSTKVTVIMPIKKEPLLSKYLGFFEQNNIGLAVFDIINLKFKFLSKPKVKEVSRSPIAIKYLIKEF